MVLDDLRVLQKNEDPGSWAVLRQLSKEASSFEDLVVLSSMRKKAVRRGIPGRQLSASPLKLAILGGYSLYPLHEILTHLIEVEGQTCELFLGEFDNYVSEILDPESGLYRFQPQIILLLPPARRAVYSGALTDSRETVQAAIRETVSGILELCQIAHQRSGAEVLLANFPLPSHHDPGHFRTTTLASDWNFLKSVNTELGLGRPSSVRICDLEFLTNRLGALAAEDPRGWFESKQPCSPSLLVAVCREAAHLILSLRTPPRKLLALDLDNTLWGGVIADDGMDGIEIGDTSPRAEAFKAFQKYILSLKDRGVLLAVCSKNDHARAMEPFEKHPEMVLRAADFTSFKANWDPKSDNLRLMADELNLSLDSFVFVDDNPAEIDIVRQFAPAVSTILLGDDPASYTALLRDCRLFEPHSLTAEDALRNEQYRAESERASLMGSAADMDSYLESLHMEARINDFTLIDAPRLAQLINKSNQFNLTTRRRTEAEVKALIGDPGYICISARLKDRFGDHGLISIVIGRANGPSLEIDTWLMSCRVLKREVEETVLNELIRRASLRACTELKGVYLPTSRNEMVRDFYPRMGFQQSGNSPDRAEFILGTGPFQPRPTKIKVQADL